MNILSPYPLFFTHVFISLSFFAWGQDQGFSGGICVDGHVPVRGETADSSELVTELLFGDAFKILKKSADQKWIYIENSFDKYQGWIHTEQAYPVSVKYFDTYQAQEHPVAANSLGSVLFKEKKVPIPTGSTLPFYKEGFIRIGQEKFKFEGSSKIVEEKTDKKSLIGTAKNYLGTPYLWGGKTPEGLDCSGFTQVVFKMHGYKIPRDSYQQAEKGKIVALAEAQPGDLFFFTKKKEANARIVHVGIYLGNNKLIHAFDTVQIDPLDAEGNLSHLARYIKFIKRIE